VCLRSDEYDKPDVLVMPVNPTDNYKQVWEYKMNYLLKTERVHKGNL